MNDSINLKNNGDFSFRFDRTRPKLDKFDSTSSDDITFDDFNNSSNQNRFTHSSPIPVSNFRFMDNKNDDLTDTNDMHDIDNGEYHEKINTKLGLRPMKRYDFNFNSYQDLVASAESPSVKEDSNDEFIQNHIQMQPRLSLQESTIDAYRANKKCIDFDDSEPCELKRSSFHQVKKLNKSKTKKRSVVVNDPDLNKGDDSFLSTEYDDVFYLSDYNKNEYSRNINWSKTNNSHGSDSCDENSLQLDSSKNSDSISSDEFKINYQIQANLPNLRLNKSYNNKLLNSKDQNLERSLVCFYNHYINSEYGAKAQSQNFDEFIDSLVESTRKIDINNNNDASKNDLNNLTELTNTSKTRSLIFFLEGFESSIHKSHNDTSFKSSVSSAIGVDNDKNSLDLKDIELILMSYYNRLKEISNDSYLVMNYNFNFKPYII